MPPRTSPNRASLAGIKDPLYPALKAPVNEIRESGAGDGQGWFGGSVLNISGHVFMSSV